MTTTDIKELKRQLAQQYAVNIQADTADTLRIAKELQELEMERGRLTPDAANYDSERSRLTEAINRQVGWLAQIPLTKDLVAKAQEATAALDALRRRGGKDPEIKATTERQIEACRRLATRIGPMVRCRECDGPIAIRRIRITRIEESGETVGAADGPCEPCGKIRQGRFSQPIEGLVPDDSLDLDVESTTAVFENDL